MDLQTILDNALEAERAEQMKTSPQLTLGELILKLEAIENKDLRVIFDVGRYYPTGIGSWRGSYNELALEYNDNYVGRKLAELLKILRPYVGATLTGYKGGEYLMGKTTPVWVANYGESAGFREGTGVHDYLTAVVDVIEKEDRVVIKTASLEYL